MASSAPASVRSNAGRSSPASSTRRSETSSRPPPTRWTQTAIEQLLLALVAAQAEGHSSDNGMKRTAFIFCSEAIQREIGKVYSDQQCKNKYHGLKATWSEWRAHNDRSGWGVDPDLGVPTAAEDIMDEYFKTFPHRRPFRTAPPMFPDLMEKVFGSGTARGLEAYSGEDIRTDSQLLDSDLDALMSGLDDSSTAELGLSAPPPDSVVSSIDPAPVPAMQRATSVASSMSEGVPPATQTPVQGRGREQSVASSSAARRRRHPPSDHSALAMSSATIAEHLATVTELIRLQSMSPIQQAIGTVQQDPELHALSEEERDILIEILENKHKASAFNALTEPAMRTHWVRREIQKAQRTESHASS